MARLGFLDKINTERLSKREKIIGIIAISLITISLAVYLYIPEGREVKSINSDLQSLKTEIDLLNKQLPDLRRRINELNKIEDGRRAEDGISRKIGDILPGGDSLSVLLEEITRLARWKKVDFISIRPFGIEDKGSYLELAMKIAIKSRYRQVGEYLGMLENLPRAVKIRDIKVESNGGINPYVMCHLDLVTYMGKR